MNQRLQQLAPKIQKWSQIKSKSKIRIEENIETKSCSFTWVDPKIVFEPYPDPKNIPLGPQKIKSDPKFKWKPKVRIEENIENKNRSATWVQPQI